MQTTLPRSATEQFDSKEAHPGLPLLLLGIWIASVAFFLYSYVRVGCPGLLN